MADSSPKPSSPGLQRPTSSSGEIGATTIRDSASRASVPPSEPRGSRASLAAIDAQVDRPARLQLIVALILGLVLVAIPLYLWRRPRAESIAVSVVQDASAPILEPPPSPAPENVTVSEPKSTCHDPGPKRTPPEQCDHLVEVEKALAQAAIDSASCITKDQGGGTIVFAAEVTLGKKRALAVSTPKEGRSIKHAKVVAGCQAQVKARLSGLSLDGLKHDHQRYRITVTATYPGAVKP